jgi:NitT/TauT family transport system substrate-binding protein
MKQLIGVRGLTALAAVMLAGACGGAAPATQASLGTANIRTSFPADGRFCYLYLAVAKGYFKSQGLDLKIEEGPNSTQVLQTVASGQDFMSEPAISIVPSARAQDAKVKVVAALEQQSAAGVVVHGNGSIQTPDQLAGKTILVGPGDAATLLPPFLRANSVDPATVKITNTDHPTKLQTFLAGQGDGATIFSEGELPLILKTDPQARFFPYNAKLALYGLGLVVSEDTLAKRPEAVKAAVKGVIDAEAYAKDHPAECVDALVAAFPDRKFDRDVATGQLTEHLKLVFPAGNAKAGSMTDERWKGMEDILVQYFGLAKPAAAAGDYYTNQMLP